MSSEIFFYRLLFVGGLKVINLAEIGWILENLRLNFHQTLMSNKFIQILRIQLNKISIKFQ